MGVNPHMYLGVPCLHDCVPPPSPHYTESPTGVSTPNVLAQQGPNTSFSSEACASPCLRELAPTMLVWMGVCGAYMTVYVICASPSGSVSISAL